MAEQKEKLERKSSKSRLSKQDEVEELEEEEDTSPSSETSDATIVPAGSETSGETPGGSPENHSPEENKKLESQRSTDSDKNSPTQGNSKGKVLVRSKALREAASPPPPEEPVIAISTISVAPTSPSITISTPASDSCSSLLSPTPQRSRKKLEKDSSQSSLSDTGTSPCLSRDSSIEMYTDSTGIDLEEFLKTTLNKNAKDKVTLIKLEKELGDFIKDTSQEYHKFPQMTSYHRMLVHRCAAFFGLDHNVDQTGKCIIVNRTACTRIPDFKFSDHVREDDEPVKQILKRSSKSFDEGRSPDKLAMDKKSKSVEEREYEYEKVKKRIFNQDSLSSQDGPNVENNNTSRGSTRHSSARSSKEDLRLTDVRPWSSTDSSGYGTDTSTKKLPMTKASSFGGSSNVTVLSKDRTSSGCLSTKMSKTESASSSTSSNLGSPLARPPPIPSSPPPEDHMESSSSSQSAASPAQSQSQQGSSPSPQGGSGLPFTVEPGQPLAIWVASTFDSIPPGVMIINPQTGQPYLNRDGSLYRYQPHHVAPFLSSASKHHQPSSSNSSSPGQVMHGITAPSMIPHVLPQQSVPVSHQSHIPTMVNTGPHMQQSYPTYSPEQKPYHVSHETSELPQQFSQMTISHQSSLPHQLSLPHQASLGHQPTLTHQSSTESLPDHQPPMGMQGPPQQPQQQPQQHQQMYMMPSQATMGQYMQGGTQYYPQQTHTGPPQTNVRLVYPHTGGYQQPQQQQTMEGQPPTHVQHPTMSVTQQTPPGGAPQYNGGYMQPWGQPAAGGYPPNVYQSQSDPNFNQTYHQSSQYNVPSSIAGGAGDYQFAANTGGSAAPQTNYSQQGGFHSTPTSASHIVNFTQVPGAASSTNLTYQPRSPPLQIPLNNPQMAAPVSLPGGSVGSSGQYVGYSYSSGGAPGMAPNHRPQGIVTFPNSAVMPTQSPPQHYAMVRPNMQMNMQLPARTTPPPNPASGAYSVPLVAAGQPVKVISSLERKHNELYSQSVDHPYKDASGGGMLGSGNQLLASVGKPAIGASPMLRPVPPNPPFRPNTPLNASDIRFIGQPLQQFQPRLPLFTSRTRMSVPGNQLTLPAMSSTVTGAGGGGNSGAAAMAAVVAAANHKLSSGSRSAGSSSSSRGKKSWSRSALGSSVSCTTAVTTTLSITPITTSTAPPTNPATAVCSSTNSGGIQQDIMRLPSPQFNKVQHSAYVTSSDLIHKGSLNAHGNHMNDGESSVVKAAITKVLKCSTNGIVTKS